MQRLVKILTDGFPVWVVVCSVLALFRPGLFEWFGPAIIWGLAIIMLGMGLTLRWEDLRAVLQTPRPIAVGVAAQYTIMPLLGWSIAHLMRLDIPLAVGLILVSCCPGGTASNVVAYLARANVALSVLMTMCSTFAAVFMTPVLTKWLAGTLVEVDAWGLFLSTVQVVLLPVVIGMTLNALFPRFVRYVIPYSPLVSVVTIALICASIIGKSASVVKESGAVLLASVFLLHAGAFTLGYLLARILGYHEQICRTLSIEVGMQNSGLGAALAKKHFADPLTPVPCAISAVFHSVIGSVLAGIWRLRPARAESPFTTKATPLLQPSEGKTTLT